MKGLSERRKKRDVPSAKAIKLEHEQSHETKPAYFDYYCVAHGPDYSPKYMDGEICHDGMDEGWCNEEYCRLCPQRCPHEPCPWGDDDELL